MANLGTKKFYKSFNSKTEENNQILKNSGYVSIVLHSAFYKSKGNFWQKTFGGSDKIALTSTITYQSSEKSIEAKSIVDKRKVKADRNHPLGLTRNIALKVPAIADGLEMKVEISAIKGDNFENSLDLMNSEEFQKPLQTASLPVGQILAVTNVIKKIFTGVNNPSILEATFAGIISKEKVTEPVTKERLTEGYIIIIANNDEDDNFLSQVEPDNFTIEGDGLKYNDATVEHTNLVFAVTFEQSKGPDQDSAWFKKYQRALNKLDEIVFAENEAEQKKILDDSRRLWIEGNAILFEDPSFIDKEKNSIKLTYFKKINERYTDLTSISDTDFIVNFTNNNFEELKLSDDFNSFNEKKILNLVNKESSKYLKELGDHNMILPL
ncbi:hypothetical protein [Zunongwangia endophytica]|uniref:Uncharacterized protein n=1 Tax=Zunongwangia endophytica TaxID=1808945 RepID=A0ABV8HD80_9FLAO|nr:hypothetical protein [Zunongwangia endophytica]MDN3594663.1 hypothetical protein [Zunongwangia endophytica]